MTVWAEQVFLLNAALDWALLAGTVRLRGGKPGKRLIWAAVLGGALAVIGLFPPFQGFWCSSAGFLVLTGCAFGCTLDGLRKGLVFLGLSLALCGIQMGLQQLSGRGLLVRGSEVLMLVSCRGLLASSAVLYGGCAVLSGAVHSRKRLILPVTLTAAGRTVRFPVLSDTGSFLRDPLTGKPVLLADGSVAMELLGLRREHLRSPALLLETLLQTRPELYPRLIPYRAIGVEQGMLIGIRCTALRIGTEDREGGIAAFSPEDVSDDGSYHGLTGG